ncbi:hypothetical protein KJ673_00025, partial [Patescibacteria group bacterium]|nr:hypothetical protein [Patescibacteria group bacterium]
MVCAQSRNQTGSSSGAGDYRPGPVATDWFCVNCVTSGVSEPVSLGYLKLYHQGLGTIKLNLIKAS